MYPFVNYYKIVNVILKEVSILSWAAQSRFWEKMVENCFFYTDIWWIKNKRLKLIDEIWWYSNRCQLKLRPVCRVSNRNSVARNCADLHATVLELRASKINLRWKPTMCDAWKGEITKFTLNLNPFYPSAEVLTPCTKLDGASEIWQIIFRKWEKSNICEHSG